MKKLICILLTPILFTCCTEYSGGGGDFESKLSQLETGSSLFSYVFNAQQVGGLSVSAMIYSFGGENTCEFLAYEGERGLGPPSFNMIKIDINQAATGSFEVVPSLSDCDGFADSGKLASVRYQEVDDWRGGFWVAAVSGSIDVEVVPETVPDWNAGVRFEGSLSVSFPVNFMRTTGCTTVEGPDFWQETCTCEDDEGNTSECENQSPGDDCCQWMSEERIAFQAELISEQCPDLCAGLMCAGEHAIPYSCEDLN